MNLTSTTGLTLKNSNGKDGMWILHSSFKTTLNSTLQRVTQFHKDPQYISQDNIEMKLKSNASNKQANHTTIWYPNNFMTEKEKHLKTTSSASCWLFPANVALSTLTSSSMYSSNEACHQHISNPRALLFDAYSKIY